jgi:hypothetical protein
MDQEYCIFNCGPQVSPQVSRLLADTLQRFVQLLLFQLDQTLDKRLVSTFFGLLLTIIAFRDRVNGLLLSELGGYLLSPRQAPAGTKRPSNLLRSSRWSAALIENFMWQQTEARVQALQTAKHTPLLIWDESVLEKKRVKAAPVRGCVRCVVLKSNA